MKTTRLSGRRRIVRLPQRCCHHRELHRVRRQQRQMWMRVGHLHARPVMLEPTLQWVHPNVRPVMLEPTLRLKVLLLHLHARPVMLEPTPASSVQILHPRARRVWLVRLLHFRPVRPVASVR